jgi:hypothetical protein
MTNVLVESPPLIETKWSWFWSTDSTPFTAAAGGVGRGLTAAIGTTGGFASVPVTGVPAVARGRAPPAARTLVGDCAPTRVGAPGEDRPLPEDGIGQAGVVGRSAPDAGVAPAAARPWRGPPDGRLATIVDAIASAAASTVTAATVATGRRRPRRPSGRPAARRSRRARGREPAFGNPSWPKGPARYVTLTRRARPADVLSAQALSTCPGRSGGSAVHAPTVIPRLRTGPP